MNIPITQPILIIVWHYYWPPVYVSLDRHHHKNLRSRLPVAWDYLYNRLTDEKLCEMKCL